jgi:vacuolar-type H+-ATPase subunit E/Vma4
MQEIRTVVDGFVEALKKKIEEILSPTQLEKFIELQGKPFR